MIIDYAGQTLELFENEEFSVLVDGKLRGVLSYEFGWVEATWTGEEEG